MALPQEGKFAKLTDEELSSTLKNPMREANYHFIKKINKCVKVEANKETIFEDFHTFGQLRCQRHWLKFKPVFQELLQAHWDQTSENSVLYDFTFLGKIYTNINDSLHQLLEGVSFVHVYTMNSRFQEPDRD